MTSFSPAATYHAEVRERLQSFAQALAVQRLLNWFTRGLLAGLLLDLGLIAWAWTREAVAGLPLPALVLAPLAAGTLSALTTLARRTQTDDLARRVDRAAGLQERSVTALELGRRGTDHPLAIAQMRDTVEHLQRVNVLEAFPLRTPRVELVAALALVTAALMVAFAPNPWLVRARAANPAISAAREQAQRIDRLADSMPADQAPELDQVRDLLKKGAKTIDTRSTEPEAALGALEDLEEKIRQLSAGDDELQAALAAIASALAADPSTSQLASAINTGDLREVSRAARDLAQRTEQMTGEERERVSRTLRDAANRAGRASPSLANQLGSAANAMQSGSGAQQGAGSGQQGASGERGDGGQSDGSAADALNDLARNAAGAAERQRAQSQLESSRNALERSLGRSQSRSTTPSGRSSSSSQRNQRSQAEAGDQGQGAGQGEPGDQSGAGEQGSGSTGGQEPGDGQPGGSGYGTGTLNRTGPNVSDLDTITRPEQVSGGDFRPDQTSSNPYLGAAGDGSSQAGDEQVRPTYAGGSTQGGGDNSSIPLGLRDLVKDYFSGLDQK